MKRELKGVWKVVASGIALALVIFHIYTGGWGLLPDMEQRSVHVLLALSLTFILMPGVKRSKPENKVPIWDILAVLGVVAVCVNFFLKYKWYLINVGESETYDIILGVLSVVLVLEGARRSIGWFFPTFVGILLIYTLFGPWFPGLLRHPGIKPLFIIQSIYQSPEGVWGYVTGLSSTIIAMFIIFGAFILFSGGGDSFFKIAIKIAGRLPGGPALVAVIASALFGTISGSTVANVVTTGTFTIPAMKRLGYKPSFAGAVEAVASTGGQIMPPIMGAGAFIMAELLSVSYLSIIIAAIIPAVLYYAAVFICVLLQAYKQNLSALPREEIPPTREVLSWSILAPIVIPVAILLGFLVAGRSLVTCGFWACATAGVLHLFKDFSLLNMKQRIKKAIFGLEEGGKSIVSVVALLVAANIAVELLALNGLAVKLSGEVVSVGQDNLALAYIFCSVMALILGMGLPTVAAYVVAAAVGVPSLVALRVPALQAHFFIFYFACMGSITPPVCAAVYAAAPIAKAPWLAIGFNATRLGIVAYLVPFAFVEEPALLMVGSPLAILGYFLLGVVAIFLIAPAVIGYLSVKGFRGDLIIPVRIPVLLAGILVLLPLGGYRLLAVPLLILAFIVQKSSSWLKQRQGKVMLIEHDK
jgi:TRAP transporter 4TM/12TM fusion protein